MIDIFTREGLEAERDWFLQECSLAGLMGLVRNYINGTFRLGKDEAEQRRIAEAALEACETATTAYGYLLSCRNRDGVAPDACADIGELTLAEIYAEAEERDGRDIAAMIQDNLKRVLDRGMIVRGFTGDAHDMISGMEGKVNETQAAANLAANNAGKLRRDVKSARDAIKDDLDGLKRQGDNNARTLAEVRTDTAAVAATMPDADQWAQLMAAVQASKSPRRKVSLADAAKILDLVCGHDSRFNRLTGQTVGNWVKKGYCTRAPTVPLTEADFTGKAAFLTWVQRMCAEVTMPKTKCRTVAVGSAIERATSGAAEWCGLKPNLTPEVMRKVLAL